MSVPIERLILLRPVTPGILHPEALPVEREDHHEMTSSHSRPDNDRMPCGQFAVDLVSRNVSVRSRHRGVIQRVRQPNEITATAGIESVVLTTVERPIIQNRRRKCRVPPLGIEHRDAAEMTSIIVDVVGAAAIPEAKRMAPPGRVALAVERYRNVKLPHYLNAMVHLSRAMTLMLRPTDLVDLFSRQHARIDDGILTPCTGRIRALPADRMSMRMGTATTNRNRFMTKPPLIRP